MSRLTEIYAALADIPVSAAGKTPTVYGYDALPTAVTTAQLPCRLLTPFDRRLEAQAGALTLGGGQVIRWRLTDLLVWTPTGQGRGLAEHSDALVAYCEAYAAAVGGATLDTSASRATVVAVAFAAGVFRYPTEDSSPYYGVECAVTVEEIA